MTVLVSDRDTRFTTRSAFWSSLHEHAAQRKCTGCMCVYACMHACVRARVCERERERETEMALGASLIFGSLLHHNTTSRVELVDGVIAPSPADDLQSFAGNRRQSGDWPDFVSRPLVKIAHDHSAA